MWRWNAATIVRLATVIAVGLLAMPAQGASAAPAWTQFGGPADDAAEAVTTDAAGNTYVVGGVGSALPGKAALGDRDAFVRTYDQYGHRVWTDQFGSASLDEARAVAVDRDGNVYVAGIVGGALPGQASAGGSDAFVRKYGQGAGGARWRVWTRQFGSPTNDFANGVAVDGGGNLYVVGGTIGALPGQEAQPCLGQQPCIDAFVRKYDRDGDEVWTRQFGTAGADLAGAVAVDVVGDAYVAGQAGGALPGKAAFGDRDAFVRKYDRRGFPVWTDQFGTADIDGAGGVAVDRAGNVYVAGAVGPFTLFGGPAPGRAFLRRYVQRAGIGALVWSTEFGVNSTADAVALDAAGAVYVAGAVRGALPGQAPAGGVDAFVRKYHLAGEAASEAWTRQFGSPGEDQARGVAAVGGTDQSAVVGSTTGSLLGQVALGGADAFAARVGAD